MQKAYKVFIQKYGHVPLIFVLIYHSIPTLSSNFLILIFQEHSSLTSSYLVIMSFCKMDIFTYNFNTCLDCCFRRYKVQQDSSLLAVLGAKWQRHQVRPTEQPGINIMRTKNQKQYLLKNTFLDVLIASI